MDITNLIESAKQLSRQYERNAMNSEMLIEQISGFNQDALALGHSASTSAPVSQPQNPLQSPSSSSVVGAGTDSGPEELEQNDQTSQHKSTSSTSFSHNVEASTSNNQTIKHSRAALLRAVQSDSNQLRDLYEENQSLKEELSEYQFGLELIMSKYRRNVLECLDDANRIIKLETHGLESARGDQELQGEIISLTDQVEDMRNVLAEQVLTANAHILDDQRRELHQLKIEFDNLRELCDISRKFGSAPPPTPPQAPSSNRSCSPRTDTPDTVIEKSDTE